MRVMILFVVICIAVFLSPCTAKAASFSCSEARSTLEILICADPGLSSLDGEVGQAYARLRSTVAPGSEQSLQLLSIQRDFLKERTEVCNIPVQPQLSNDETSRIIACLKGHYTLRLNVLTEQIKQQEQQTASIESSTKSAETVQNMLRINTLTEQNKQQAQQGIPVTASNLAKKPSAPETESLFSHITTIIIVLIAFSLTVLLFKLKRRILASLCGVVGSFVLFDYYDKESDWKTLAAILFFIFLAVLIINLFKGLLLWQKTIIKGNEEEQLAQAERLKKIQLEKLEELERRKNIDNHEEQLKKIQRLEELERKNSLYNWDKAQEKKQPPQVVYVPTQPAQDDGFFSLVGDAIKFICAFGLAIFILRIAVPILMLGGAAMLLGR